MAIQNASDSQKVDYLWKKIAYGATKTDIAGNIDATQEPFPSPLQIRADKILQNSDQIPAVIPGSNTSVVTVYTTSLPVECTSDAGIATPTLTWTTGRNFWIPPEFGSTYQVKVYISPSGQANNVATKGTQVFATGSGNNDLWVFDYQSGILNFNSNNTPYNASNNPISFTGNSVYISGAVYAGAFGLPSTANIGNVILGNVTFSNTTISTSITGANLILSPTGVGAVQIAGTGAFGLPTGTSAQRPTTVAVGYARFNTDIDEVEFWDGTQWITPGLSVITSDVITPNGTSNTYSLTSNSTTTGVMVSINGTIQQPYTAYNIVSNNQIQFTETPLTSDIIEVRHMAQGAATISSLSVGQSSVTLDAANVNITGNLLPSANVTYSLGSSTLQWKDLWVSSNTVYIGGAALSVINGTLSLDGNSVMPVPFSNINVKAYTESMGFANYSNVNVAAYTQTQSFTNYSNVNVAAYTQTQSYTNYSNVNVAAYTQTQSYTNYSNVNLSAYLGGSVTIGGNLTVNGNLNIAGNLTTYNANNLTLDDSIIYLAANNAADLSDIGIVGHFTNPGYQHTGFVRDHADGTWKLFANVTTEPTTVINFTNATYSNLKIGNLTAIGITSTGYFNTTANISAAVGNFGNVSVAGGMFTGINAFTPTGNSVVNLGTVNNQWNIIYGAAITAQYADLAENYVADFDYAPGTVVEFGGIYEITQCNTDMSSAVAGIVSENPAYLMNSGQQGTHIVAVALQGRVRTQVTGTIRKGNMLVSAGNGLARADSRPEVGTVLGKALEDFDGLQGIIEIVVGVR